MWDCSYECILCYSLVMFILYFIFKITYFIERQWPKILFNDAFRWWLRQSRWMVASWLLTTSASNRVHAKVLKYKRQTDTDQVIQWFSRCYLIPYCFPQATSQLMGLQAVPLRMTLATGRTSVPVSFSGSGPEMQLPVRIPDRLWTTHWELSWVRASG